MDNILQKRIEKLVESDNSLRGRPATDNEIKDAEINLNIKFDTQYIDFIKIFGGAFCGIAIHAFDNGDMIGNETVTELTQRFRQYTTNLSNELMNSYVISDDGAGNPILTSRTGHILIYFHDSGETEVLHTTFNDLLNQALS
ncbi:SMI1/KNR4 family protein [Pseudomonas putida]|uniref:SMI1/KNR4 family protein n=1 Tax=Pseudomonas putida TaxID=303 RepID=A0A8I1JLS7_PSEPU|nr:SMI1/KNR4 family protein [Pseudomonas putida]MBI6888652.1 SMI1/KNR4 family protein [Pseudomonas putida]